MALRVQFESNKNRFHFEDFSTASLSYQENIPQDLTSFVHVEVIDAKTEKILSIFLQTVELRRIGISVTTWQEVSHIPKYLSQLIRYTSVIDRLLKNAIQELSAHLNPQYLAFFENRPLATRIICSAIHQKVEHFQKKGVPGIYMNHHKDGPHIFINLKKTHSLGQGTFGKVRKVLWLSAPLDRSKIIAKKVCKSAEDAEELKLEMVALRTFSGKRGIISLIAAGKYDGKWAIFVPLYECNLWEWIAEHPFELSLNNKCSMISQWLEGLAVIAEAGIHGDMKPGNLLLKRVGKKVEAVIADFGTYRSYGQEEHGLTTITVAPPEYYAEEKKVTSKQDVWGLGLSMHEVFSKHRLPCWDFWSLEKMERWISKLSLNWILECPIYYETPHFVIELINQMLDPRLDSRLSANEALELFSSGNSSFNGLGEAL